MKTKTMYMESLGNISFRSPPPRSRIVLEIGGVSAHSGLAVLIHLKLMSALNRMFASRGNLFRRNPLGRVLQRADLDEKTLNALVVKNLDKNSEWAGTVRALSRPPNAIPALVQNFRACISLSLASFKCLPITSKDILASCI